MRKVLITVLLCFILFFFFTVPRYGSDEFGFSVKDTKGWFKIPNQSEMKYSISTKDSQDKSVSFIGIAVFKHHDVVLDDVSAFITDTCKSEWGALDVRFTGIEKVNINGLPGLVCTGEGKPTKVNALYIFKMYTLQNKKGSQYDYVISVSYPKDNNDELVRVENVINSFQPYYFPVGYRF